jgi:hypothetical protein
VGLRPTPLRECAACGGQWFRLRDDDLPDGMGIVSVDADELIAAYSGAFECARCHTMLDGMPAVGHGQLRLVQ